jgi:ribosomal protein S14
MIRKLRQQLNLRLRTAQNRVPNRRSRQFIINYLRQQRLVKTSYFLRAALGFTLWLIATKNFLEERVAHRAECFISGRSRGTTQEFTVARTQVRILSSQYLLFGVQKSSF